jgi:Adenylate and Guanylate cyclase catalytic domain
VHEDDALRALRAARDLRDSLATLNDELERDYGVSLAVRTGVNTGEAVTGAEERLATGDALNVAARLEQAAQPDEILIGEQTRRLARGAIEVEAVEPLSLKGKAEPLACYRLLSVVEGAPAIERRLDVPLVGRRDELLRVRAIFDEAVAERRAARPDRAPRGLVARRSLSASLSCPAGTPRGTPGLGPGRRLRLNRFPKLSPIS